MKKKVSQPFSIIKSFKIIQLEVQKRIGLNPLGASPLLNGDIIHV